MTKIHSLSAEIIAQIAAGEVIERPGFAVKELLENAIDAGATDIHISLENGGITKILVADNGEGMSKEDLLLSFLPHTTSKIDAFDKLSHIKTFGFRGEALASIAAVSKLTLQSRTKDNPGGYKIKINGGQREESPIGMPTGTKIFVENIFQNIPARKKFLKSRAIELRHSIDIISTYALCFSDIAFTLSHNKKTIFTFPKQKQKERVQEIFGTEAFSQLIPYKKEEGYIKIDGYISHPQLQAKTKRKQFLFVNGRLVKSNLISLAIQEAYGSLLQSDTFPLYVLFIQLPVETVDVNVHPRKEIVNFLNEAYIFSTVKQLIQEVLSENNITFQNISWHKNLAKGLTQSFGGKLLKDKVVPTQIALHADCIQLQNTYIVAQTKEGIIIIDQHAASERIFYEKYQEVFTKEKGQMKIYHLPQSVTYNLSTADTQIMIEYLRQFEKLGFGIEHFKKNTFLLRFVPEILKDRNFLDILLEQIDHVASGREFVDIDTNTQKMIAFLACRSAIKAGDKLTKEQQKQLLRQLEITPNNTICAHGRPTKIEFTTSALEHMFGRV